jgi:hypothetical protein
LEGDIALCSRRFHFHSRSKFLSLADACLRNAVTQ